VTKAFFFLKNILVINIILISAQSFGQKFFIPEGITYKKLDNGFSYYLLPDDGERGKITIHLVSSIGSLVEHPDERGVAHFVEHMVFKGSKNYPGEETMHELDKMGLKIGRDYNASVNSTMTEYHINLPEDNWMYLKKTLLLMKDWVSDLQMEENSFKVEQKVVIEEIKKRNSTFSPYLNGTILEGHGGLGSEDQINGITANQVKDFYTKHYTPEHFALFIQGRIDEKQVAKYLDKIFSKIPINKYKVKQSYIDVTNETVVDSNYMSTAKNSKQSLIIAFKTPSFAINSKEGFKENFIQYMFCKILENRLATYPDKSINETSITKGEMLPGSMMYNFRLQGKNAISYSTMLDSFCKAVSEARTHGFTQEEIDFFVDEFIKKNQSEIKEDKVTFSEAQNHFLTGDVPLTYDERYKLLIELQENLKPENFSDILNTFTKNNKTILFDCTSDLYTVNFTKSYILNKLEHINNEFINPPKYKFITPTGGFVIKNKTNLPDIILEKKLPVVIANKKMLGTDLYLLEYKNGMRVVVNNSLTAKPQIRIVSKHGLDMLSQDDQQNFAESLEFFNNNFNGLSEKESASFLRQYMFSNKAEISKNNFEMELRSGNTTLNYENLLKAFYLVVAKENQPNALEILEKLNANKNLDSLNKADFNEAMVKRMFEYNQLFKRNLKDAYVYVGGDLPTNIDSLISTYIATIPTLVQPENISEEVKIDTLISPKYIEDRKVKTQSRASFIFIALYDKRYTIKDDLIAEAIAEYGYHQIFEILRKKHGLIYSLGTTGSGEMKTKTSLVSLRYIADNTNLQKCKDVMVSEILTPMNRGEVSKETIEIARAMLSSKLDLYFYDDDVVSNTYLKMALDNGKLFTVKDLNEEINKITSNDIIEAMKSIIRFPEGFEGETDNVAK